MRFAGICREQDEEHSCWFVFYSEYLNLAMYQVLSQLTTLKNEKNHMKFDQDLKTNARGGTRDGLRGLKP